MQKLLAIDDKADNLVILSALLKNLMPDCVVITAQSGMEGIEKAKVELPDAILLDVKMPDMDGFETCNKLKTDERTSHIPVIMITAIRTDPQSRVKGLEIGADAFLAKPIDEYELVSQVKVALRIKKAEDALREERDALEKTVQERTATLRESEEKHRILLEESSDPIFAFTPEGQYKYANRAFAKGVGKRVEDIIGKKIWDVFPKEEADKRFASLSQVFHTGEENVIEVRVPRADGDHYYITTITPIKDTKGETLSAICSSKDITDRRRAEEEKRNLEERLLRAEKMEALGLLAGGVAHDLNNVVGIVVGYAEMLLSDTDEENPMRGGLQNIMDGGQRAAAIVQDLLTLARRGVAGRKVLNLNRLILYFKKSPEGETLLSYHPSVQIKTDLEPDLLNISASSVHLDKTLFNLFSNAVEAMPKGGTLSISTTNQYLDKPVFGYDRIREGDYVVLSVSDTGEGIPESDLKRIFEPFYTKKVMGRSGTGLGLSVVWGTVKDHNGYIDVQSKTDKGTTFTLYFPAVREDITAEASSRSISEYMGNGESILVVDDIKGQRDLAAALLQKLNYQVAVAASGEDAVEYLKKHKVDLLVLDMIMDPGMDGLDTYQRVLTLHPQQKVIIVSGFSESDRVNAAHDLGAGEYVKKPYVIEKLGLAVKNELARLQT